MALKTSKQKAIKKKVKDDLGINFNNGGNTGAKCLKNKQTKAILKKLKMSLPSNDRLCERPLRV